MLKLKKVAVTGGLSSGKSVVCRILRDLGAYVVDADQIAHQLLTPNTEVGTKAIDLLGPEILVKGKIDRSRVAAKVFHHPKLLRELEKLIHPLVYAEIQNQYSEQDKKKNGPQLFVAEIPLLFESHGESYFDKTIAVVSFPETCWKRYRNSTGGEKEDFNRRMARQMSPEEKSAKADYVIRNDGTEEDLKKQVKTLYNDLIQASS